MKLWIPTAAAYLACIISTLLGVPPITNVSEIAQLVFYTLGGSLMMLRHMNPTCPKLKWFLSIGYGIGGMFAFTGLIDWGGPIQNVGMAFWDLVIAINAQENKA